LKGANGVELPLVADGRSSIDDMVLEVVGCSSTTIAETVIGCYERIGENHGRPLFQRVGWAPGAPTGVLIYYWDDRDGQSMSGWWFGPEIGGDQVWAFNGNRASPTPPAVGWRVPWDGPVDARMRLKLQGVRRPGEIPAGPTIPAKRPRSANGGWAGNGQDPDGRFIIPPTEAQAQAEEMRRAAERGAEQARLERLARQREQREDQAVLTVRKVITSLSAATFDTFEQCRQDLEQALEANKEAMGPHANRVSWEARDAVKQALLRLQQEAVESVRQILQQVTTVALEDWETRRDSLAAEQVRLEEWLGDQASTIASEAAEALTQAQRRVDQLAANAVRKVIRRLADEITLENADHLRDELEQALTRQRDRMTIQLERVQDEAAEALLEAQQRVQELLEERAARQREADRVELLVGELVDGVVEAEEEAERAIAASKAVACGDLRPEEALTAAQIAEDSQEAARARLRSSQVAVGKCVCEYESLLSAVESLAEARTQLGKLQARVVCMLEELEDAAGSLRVTRERAARRATVARKEREQRELFDSYDADGDRLLCRKEVAAFAEGEYDMLEVREEFLDRITAVLGACGEDGFGGVPFERFARLRQMLAIERSEVRARARKAEEEERRRREREEAEKRQLDMAERTERARALLVACGCIVPEVNSGMLTADGAAAPLQAEDRLSSGELRAAADAAEAALAGLAGALDRAQAKLREATVVLSTDLAHMLQPEVEDLTLRLGRDVAKLDRLRALVRSARSRANRKEQDEEKARKQRKAFAKLERAYDRLDEGESDEEEWN